MAIGSKQARKQTHIDVPSVFEGCWRLRDLRGELGGLLEPSWSGRGVSWGSFGTMLRHRKLS
eukprot:9485369-Pyramimonas_sp.AAC.2